MVIFLSSKEAACVVQFETEYQVVFQSLAAEQLKRFSSLMIYHICVPQVYWDDTNQLPTPHWEYITLVISIDIGFFQVKQHISLQHHHNLIQIQKQTKL
jgi:hypothetical protein